MKILWFTQTPCNGANFIKNNYFIGGWLQSLETKLKAIDNIELSVCFIQDKTMEPFYFENVMYYPVARSWEGNFIKKWIKMKYWATSFIDNEMIRQFIAIVNIVKPDIIHVHGTEECFGLLQEKVSIPVVISIQGILAPYREKLFSGVSFSELKRQQNLLSYLKLSNIEHRVAIFDRTVAREKEILAKAKYVIGRTAWDQRVMRVLAPNATYFEGNEILREPFYDKVWIPNWEVGKFKIISVISGGLYKGLEVVYKTAAILKELHIEFEWQIVGLKHSDYFVQLVEKIFQLSAANLSITYLGKKDADALSALLTQSHCYCQVSHIENSPNSLCEAMLVGVPIIASFVGGTDSLLEPNKTGILVQDGDSYSYAGAIKSLLDNNEKAIYFAANARIQSHKRHDKKKVVYEYQNTYNEIINKECKK